MSKLAILSLCVLGALPMAASAQQDFFGPVMGDREFALSGTGSSDRDLDANNFGAVAEVGWYLQDNTVWGVRQSINYADIQGEDIQNDFWNGSTRAYYDYQFGAGQAKPFVGGSLGFIYGDGVEDDAFAGLEGGIKYYVLPKTYVLGRVEYQWFFDQGSDADNTFDEGAWAYTLGLGFNF
ncbi:MAG: hypothetical protein ACI9W6_001997 [Motiliproteus sp.]|jgi:hypothetical protein